MARDKYIEQLGNSYLDAIIAGNQSLAYAIMADPLTDRVSVSQLYMDVLLPAQIAIGDMWHAGEINVAQEHLATSITLGVMEQYRYEMNPRDTLGVRATLAVLGDERHIVGIRMFADFLIMDGWEVDVLIDPTPVSDLLAFIRTRNIDLLALSFTIPGTQSITKVITDTLKEQELSTKVLLGGQALNDVGSDEITFGADGIATNAVEGIKEAKRLVGLAKENIDLETHLTDVGLEIRTFRTRLQMTQQELADRSGLDRTYISMVENGKQNLTLGAMVKIADALEVPLSSLIRN